MTDKLSSLEEIAGRVSRETFDSLVELERQLVLWNKKINLVSDTTIAEVWNRHILDAAQLLPLAPAARSWGDLGSGGGFPGLVEAIFMRESGGSVMLIESNSKKTAFLHHISGALRLPVTVRSQRIEDAVVASQAPEIVTARALASLPVLMELASPWLSAGTKGLFHKGRGYRKEVEESYDKFKFDLIEHPSKVDREGVILEIANFSKRTDR